MSFVLYSYYANYIPNIINKASSAKLKTVGGSGFAGLPEFISIPLQLGSKVYTTDELDERIRGKLCRLASIT